MFLILDLRVLGDILLVVTMLVVQQAMSVSVDRGERREACRLHRVHEDNETSMGKA